MVKYKLFKYSVIDNVTGKECDISERILKKYTFDSDDLMEFVRFGYELSALSDTLIRLAAVYNIGASNTTRYLLFKKV